MAFLGLGSFGTGLVTGFAESANVALQDSMDRIRRRIDNVSEYRVKKAISEQEQRAAEVKEVEDLIKQGSKLFKDNPRASEYAATLLDKYGIDGYKALLPKMQEAQFNNELNISNYFDIAQVSDVTTGTAKPLTINDYAEAYIGGNVKVPDYKLPPDAVPDSGLVGAIFGDIDISGRIQSQYESDIAAAGYDMNIEVPDVTLGDITFDRFKFDVDTAGTFDDRVKLYKDRLDDINLTPEEQAETEKGFDALLTTAVNSRSRDNQTKALYLQLDRSNPGSEKAQGIVQQIASIRRDDRLERAIAMGDEGAGDVLQIEAEQAWAKYKVNPTDENLQAFKDKKNEQSLFSTGRGVSLNDQLQDIQSQMMGIEDKTSPTYLALEEQAKRIRLVADAGLTAKVNQYASADALVRQEAENLSLGNPILTHQDYLQAKQLIESGTTVDELRAINLDAYKKYVQATSIIRENKQKAFNTLINTLPDDIGLKAYGIANGYITQPSTTTTPTDDITATVPADATDLTTATTTDAEDTTDMAVSTLNEQTQDAIPTDVSVDTADADAVVEDEIPQKFTYDFGEGDEEELVTVNPVEMPIKDSSGKLTINEAGEVITETRLPTIEEVKDFRAEYGDPNKGTGIQTFLGKIRQIMKNEQDRDGFVSTEFADAITEARKYGYPEEFLDEARKAALILDRQNIRALRTRNYVPFFPDEVLEGE